jgi:hypothetical protein
VGLAFVALPEIKITKQFLDDLDLIWKLEPFLKNALNNL